MILSPIPNVNHKNYNELLTCFCLQPEEEMRKGISAQRQNLVHPHIYGLPQLVPSSQSKGEIKDWCYIASYFTKLND